MTNQWSEFYYQGILTLKWLHLFWLDLCEAQLEGLEESYVSVD